MKNKFSLLIFGILFVSFVSSVTICIDKTIPSAPSSLSITSSGNDVILNWGPATDEPACSGISYYEIKRNGNSIGNTTSLTFTDYEISEGSYNYTVSAFDKVGHNQGSSRKIEIKVESESNSGGSGSSGGGKIKVVGGETENSYVCEENWKCSEWSECENGTQTRSCVDVNSCGTYLHRPALEQECGKSKSEQKSSTNFLTGAVTGIADFVKSPTGIVSVLITGIVLTGGLVFLNLRKRKISNT